MSVDREGRVRLASVTQVDPLRIQFRASTDDVPVTFSSVPGIEVDDQVFAVTQRHRVLVLAKASSPAGTNPFDARYVNKAGDTMSGALGIEATNPNGADTSLKQALGTGDGEAMRVGGTTSDLLLSIQGGHGRVVWSWNAYFDESARTWRSVVGGEGHALISLANSYPGFEDGGSDSITFATAPSNTNADDPITWKTVAFSGGARLIWGDPDERGNVDTDILLARGIPQIEFVRPSDSAGSSGRRFWIRKGNHLYFLIDDDDDGGWNSPHPMYIRGDNGNVVIGRDLTVVGAKNAEIPNPDDPTRALRFAATESNTPGVMEVYCGVHTVGTERSLTLRQEDFAGLPDEVRLADYVSIGRNPRVYVQAAGPREDSQPHAPYAWAEWDAADPRIEVRAPAGDYHIELRFIRADTGVANWKHEVEVPQDDELGEEEI